MSNKTTPGPWVAYDDTDMAQWQVHDADGREVVATGIEGEANATLIALAPELRRALANLVANEHGAASVQALCFSEARALLARLEVLA
jgi:hypothetical protein